MSLIGRLFVILFAFLAACFVAGMIVVVAVLYPEFSDLGTGMIDQSAINVLLGFGFIFLSGFALLPALIVVLITEAFYIRSVLAYAHRRRDRRRGLLSRPRSVRPRDAAFDGIVRRHLEIMTGAGIVAGLVYWMIAGRNAGAWRKPPPPLRPPPPLPSHSGRKRDEPRTLRGFHPHPPRLNRRAMNRTGLVIALGLSLVIGLLFGIFPELDLKLAALFYDPASASFPLKQSGLAAFARDGAMWIAWALALPALVAIVAKLLRPDRPMLVPGRAAVFLLVTILLSAVVLTNLTFKSYWGRPRPVMVTEFNGPWQFVPWWDPRGECGRNCSFFSGEGATAFWTYAPAALTPPAWRPLAYVGGDRVRDRHQRCCGWRSAGISSPTSRLPASSASS